jgi:hypothetical protein
MGLDERLAELGVYRSAGAADGKTPRSERPRTIRTSWVAGTFLVLFGWYGVTSLFVPEPSRRPARASISAAFAPQRAVPRADDVPAAFRALMSAAQRIVDVPGGADRSDVRDLAAELARAARAEDCHALTDGLARARQLLAPAAADDIERTFASACPEPSPP